MQKGKTLWQMWTQHWHHFGFYNPMQAKVGSLVSIDDVELASCDFAVVGIEEFARQIEGQEFKFTDYLIRDRGKTEVMRLRINPADANAAGVPHNVLILRMDDEFAYSDDFLGVLKDTTKKFVVTDEKTGATEEFWRINDVGESYKCTMAVIKSANADGSVDEDGVVRSGIEYWDYWRETNDNVGLALKEFVFVQMNSENGWFQIFRGREIDPKNVTVV